MSTQDFRNVYRPLLVFFAIIVGLTLFCDIVTGMPEVIYWPAVSSPVPFSIVAMVMAIRKVRKDVIHMTLIVPVVVALGGLAGWGITALY